MLTSEDSALQSAAWDTVAKLYASIKAAVTRRHEISAAERTLRFSRKTFDALSPEEQQRHSWGDCVACSADRAARALLYGSEGAAAYLQAVLRVSLLRVNIMHVRMCRVLCAPLPTGCFCTLSHTDPARPSSSTRPPTPNYSNVERPPRPPASGFTFTPIQNGGAAGHGRGPRPSSSSPSSRRASAASASAAAARSAHARASSLPPARSAERSASRADSLDEDYEPELDFSQNSSRCFTPIPITRGKGASMNADAADPAKESMLPGLTPMVQSRLIPALADPTTGNWWGLPQTGTKKMSNLTAWRFNALYDGIAKPLGEAFEQTHGLTFPQAYERRHRVQHKRDQLRVHNALLAKGAGMLRADTERAQHSTAAIRHWGNRISMRRYKSGRMAKSFETKTERRARGNLRRSQGAYQSKASVRLGHPSFVERLPAAVGMPAEQYWVMASMSRREISDLRADGEARYTLLQEAANAAHARKLELAEGLVLDAIVHWMDAHGLAHIAETRAGVLSGVLSFPPGITRKQGGQHVWEWHDKESVWEARGCGGGLGGGSPVILREDVEV